MSAYETIFVAQVKWALDNKIRLVGSKGARGRAAYATSLSQNLFEPLEPATIASFKRGNGSEINGTAEAPAKMQALHSSSALGVNVFQYWQKIEKVSLIASACGFSEEARADSNRISFEQKYPIASNPGIPPNVDVVIHNSKPSQLKVFAIESKFTEAYASWRHGGLKAKYFSDPTIWDEIPGVYEFAKTMTPDDSQYVHLHPAQLVKHLLGLKKGFGKKGFELLYLWYGVSGKEGLIHRLEIESFATVAKYDGIRFLSLSYQELFANLEAYCGTGHKDYLEYLRRRYL